MANEPCKGLRKDPAYIERHQTTIRIGYLYTCVRKIEKEIKEIRRDISVATAELKRLQINGKLTRKWN